METEQGKQDNEIEEMEEEDLGIDFLDDLSSDYSDPFNQTQNWNL